MSPVGRGFARALKCPLVAVPAGGYSGESPSITADTFRTIAEILPRPSARREVAARMCQGLVHGNQIIGVASEGRQADVQIAPRLGNWEDALLVDRYGVRFAIARKDGRVAVALVQVEVDDQHAAMDAILPQAGQADRDVVHQAEPMREIAAGVVEAAGEIHRAFAVRGSAQGLIEGVRTCDGVDR